MAGLGRGANVLATANAQMKINNSKDVDIAASTARLICS